MAMEMRPRYSQWVAYLNALNGEALDTLREMERETDADIRTELRFANERANMPNLSMTENPRYPVTDALIR